MTDATVAQGQAHPPSPFRFPIFRDVWIANLVSRFGGLIQSVGASWLMLGLSASPVMVSLVQVSTTLPILLLALVAGALADTFDRRRLMIVAQVFMLAVSALLAVFAHLGWIGPWTLLAFTFLIGCGAALNGPAWQASVGEMVPRPALPAAVALNSMGFNVARSVGPAVGGAVVAAAGAAAAFTLNAASYLGLLVVLARWHPPEERRTLPREPLGQAMVAGLRYVAMSPAILAVMLRSALFGIGAGAVPALMPLVARHMVGGGALTYGLLLGAFGVGAVAGALAATPLRRRLSSEAVVRVALTASALGAAGSGLSAHMLPTVAALFVAGGGWVLALSTFNVTVQLSAPRWVVARALAIYQMAAFGGMALGSWLWGWVTERSGLAEAHLGAAVVSLACVGVGLRWGLPRLASPDLQPLDRWREPALALDIQRRSGPVVITVAYRIDEADVPAFLAAMHDRRRIRRRDGARHWSLLRDLEAPDMWIERFQSPTWEDYVRQNMRMTRADADNGMALRALHRGEGPPTVHRMIERQTGTPPHPQEIEARMLAEPLTEVGRQS